MPAESRHRLGAARGEDPFYGRPRRRREHGEALDRPVTLARCHGIFDVSFGQLAGFVRLENLHADPFRGTARFLVVALESQP